MEKLELKAYTKTHKKIVLDSIGMHAFMHLTTLLWNSKTKVEAIEKLDYNIQKHTITIVTKDYIYEFANVPIQWDGRIDTHIIYTNHIEDLKESGVI